IKEWNTKPDGTGTAYALGDKYTITIDDTNPHSNEATLYAIWTKDFFSIASMQEMYPTVCAKLYTPSNATGTNATAITLTSDNAGTVPGAKATQAVTNYAGYKSIVTSSGSVSGDNQPYVAQRTLSDIRDGKTYTVRKMADGNCWMSSNLKYELYANSTRTGVNNTTGEQITFNTGAICGNGNTNAACIMNGNTAYNSTYDSWYYSWYAATAGSGTASTTFDNGDAANSICPAHWRLPTNYTNKQYPSGGAQKSWGSLVSAYGINPANHSTTSEYQILEAFPFTLPRAGYFGSGAFQNNGCGDWWSSTAHSTATHAYYLDFNTTRVIPQYGNSKYHGFNVRCVSI
ncbi:hypothetical protein IKE84_01970, partial [Candidatus Saccharibacteria bacterium]|nr:hypothetical protein [Candidatus Saccharibacteria bacterium]